MEYLYSAGAGADLGDEGVGGVEIAGVSGGSVVDLVRVCTRA